MDNPEMNAVAHSKTLAGTAAYVHAFKARAQSHHCIGYGIYTADVEKLYRLRKAYSKQVQTITALPIFIKATALAVKKYPEANSILFKKLFGFRIVRFAHVDVNVPITRVVDGETLQFICTVRRATEKTLAEIQDELRHAMKTDPDELWAIQRIKRFHKMPLWLARVFHQLMKRSPKVYVQNAGTCGLTVMNQDWGQQFFPIGPTTAVFSVGGIRKEPAVIDDEVVSRRVAHICLGVDNFVMAGPEGLGLAYEFKRLIESCDFVEAELD